MKRFKVIANTVISFGPQHVTKGQTLMLPDTVAQQLVELGVVEAIPEPEGGFIVPEEVVKGLFEALPELKEETATRERESVPRRRRSPK